jgi:hypothetical protein
MASDELFLSVHPEPAKQGLRVDRAKYASIRDSVLHNLRSYGSMTFTQLGALVEEDLHDSFSGTVLWYYTTVKLDMEARGEIRRVPDSRPQLIEVV